MFRVTFYKTEDGRKPAGEFVNSLDELGKAAVVEAIQALADEGNGLRPPKSKHLVENLFELRIRDRSNAYRMIYFFIVGEEIIVTNGFTKKTQKTPPSEIELAKKYRDDFLKRQ